MLTWLSRLEFGAGQTSGEVGLGILIPDIT